jgi:hypothetical protein
MVLLLEDPALMALTRYLKAIGCDCQGPGVCRARLRGGAAIGRQAPKLCLFVVIEMGEMISTDWARV